MKKIIYDVYVLTNVAKSSGRNILLGILSALGNRADIRLHIGEMSDYGRKALADAIQGNLVDGLITSEIEDDRLALLFETSSFPLVVIGTREQTLPRRTHNLRIVTLDEVKVAAFATRHLISCGRFASYGFIHLREDFCRHLSNLREEGFSTALCSNRLSGLVYTSPLPEEKSDATELGDWLSDLPKPAAILAAHDRRAMDVIDACSRKNLNIPEDIRLIGIDNDEILCNQVSPRLSSVATDEACEGRVAVQQLLLMIRRTHAKSGRKSIICPHATNVIERESTRVLPPGLTLVRQGLSHISANAGRNLTVDDVVTHMGVSRRLAYLRFQEFAHETIQHAITAARLAHVKRELISTRQTIDSIARTSGFTNPNNLKIIFKRETGMTMRDWRKRNRFSLNRIESETGV